MWSRLFLKMVTPTPSTLHNLFQGDFAIPALRGEICFPNPMNGGCPVTCFGQQNQGGGAVGLHAQVLRSLWSFHFHPLGNQPLGRD